MSIDEILQKHNLQAKEIEPNVLEILNPDTEVNVDKLRDDLSEYIAITSATGRYVKNKETGISEQIVKIYYLILDYSYKNAISVYFKKAKERFDQASIDSYNNRPDQASFWYELFS